MRRSPRPAGPAAACSSARPRRPRTTRHSGPPARPKGASPDWLRSQHVTSPDADGLRNLLRSKGRWSTSRFTAIGRQVRLAPQRGTPPPAPRMDPPLGLRGCKGGGPWVNRRHNDSGWCGSDVTGSFPSTFQTQSLWILEGFEPQRCQWITIWKREESDSESQSFRWWYALL